MVFCLQNQCCVVFPTYKSFKGNLLWFLSQIDRVENLKNEMSDKRFVIQHRLTFVNSK